MEAIVDKRRLYSSCFFFCLIALAFPAVAYTQVVLDSVPGLERVDIEEHLGARVPLDLTFTDDHGRLVTLGEYFESGRPVFLNLVYYECPMLCNVVLNGVTASIKQLDWLPGEEFRMVTISINPRETHDLAAAKKAGYLNEMARPGAEQGWAFLVGEESQSKALADAIGFKYFYDESIQEYAHTAAAFVLAPDGTISRYLYGIEYNPRDVRLALLEASDGKIGSTLDRLILYCYHYDPEANSYTLFATNVMRLGGLVTVSLLSLFVALLWRKERRGRQRTPGITAKPQVTENRR